VGGKAAGDGARSSLAGVRRDRFGFGQAGPAFTAKRASLNLEGTEVGDAGVRQIARLGRDRGVGNLSGTTVTDAALGRASRG